MSLKRLMCGIDLRDLKKVVTALSKAATHFNQNEMECLVKLYYSFMEKGCEQGIEKGLDRSEFRNILHSVFGMTDDMLMNRVFGAFDKDNDNHISTREWVEGLSIFLRGTFEEKVKYTFLSKADLRTCGISHPAYASVVAITPLHLELQSLNSLLAAEITDCYQVYYLNGDGYISQDEMFDMLKNSLLKHSVEEDPDEGIKELVELALKKMDYDNDGKLSYEDFERAVKKDHLLLEVFGPCLPEIEKCLEFETLVFRDINNEFQL